MLLENNPFPQDVRVYNEALSLTEAGYRVTVIAPRGEGQARLGKVDGIEVRRFRLPASGDGALALAMEFAIATAKLSLAALRALLGGAGVLHLHNPPDTLFPAALVARGLGRRVVFDHHDLTPELVGTRTGASLPVRVARWCERRTFRAATLVVSSNESYAEIARTRGGKRPEDVAVVRNGPKQATLSPGAEIRAGALSDPHLVYVGAVATKDDVDDLPEVLAALRDEHGLAGSRL
ncbi:MAG TPA: glycosyltransferase, partial [Solirubrobacteraceae bacterium]